MRILLLTRYGEMGASSRMRTYQFMPSMVAAGWEVEVAPLFSDDQLARKYRVGKYGIGATFKAYGRRIDRLMSRHRFDLVWIEKEALPWLPVGVESWLLGGVPFVLDFDDALFHNYDRHPSILVRRFLGKRLDRLMGRSRLVVAGNRYLAERAVNAGARWVEMLPTVVDLERYAVLPDKESGPLRIVWIGSPSTVRYLEILAKPLATLSNRLAFRFRVIGGGDVSIPGVDVEVVQWSTASEAALLAACQVGVMPLHDSPWERGKCAYKLIQYMACKLPCVASPVGVNCEVVMEGETGFLANTAEDWIQKLELLLRDPALRDRFGTAGRSLVQSRYCLQAAAPRLVGLLSKATGRAE